MKKKSFLALILILIFSSLIFYGLYYFNIYQNFRDPKYALLSGLIILATHLVNMSIYFSIAGNTPYSWNKYKKNQGDII
jgi:hypothetical protein